MVARTRSWAGLALIVALVAACGGGGKVSAEEYVKAICTEVMAWTGEIQTLSEEVGQNLSAEATPLEGQAVLADFLDDVVAATDDHLAGVKDAGVPDVENGEEIAGTLVGVFEDAKEILVDARAKVDELPTDDPAAFGTAADQLGGSIQSALEGVGGGLGSLESPELSEAAGAEPACAELGG